MLERESSKELDRLRAKLAEGERDLDEGRFKELSREEIGPLFAKVKEQALGDPPQETQGKP